MSETPAGGPADKAAGAGAAFETMPEAMSETMPQAVAVRRGGISVVWLIPLVAVIVGGWLAYKTYSEKGPTITIQFESAAGLQAGKTKVKFKDVEVGHVTAIDLASDLETVIVTAELTAGARAYLTEKTRFWVERPRVTASRVSGLETLLSGAYIAMDPVRDGASARHFEGLSEPPLFTTSQAGKRFRLKADSLGSLNVGSPVYYRQIQVGQVVSHRLDDDGEAVIVDIFVSSPNDEYVYETTRFWNASGIDLSISAEGVEVDTQSLLSMVAGGVAFETPDAEGKGRVSAEADRQFTLYPTREKASEADDRAKDPYLMFFQGSVRGLEAGAPVLLRGIKVGQVLDVQLTFNMDALAFQIPVLIEVEPERVVIVGDRSKLEGVDRIEWLVSEGLRGQLKSGSLITGKLYVDLGMHPDAPPEKIEQFDGHRVLPTLPTPMDALASRATDALDQVASILAKIDAIPIEQIGEDAAATLVGTKALVDSSALQGTLSEAEASLSALHDTADRLNTEIAPGLVQTLDQATAAMRGVRGVISDRSPVIIEMNKMFRELAAAAHSVRVIADYLERHPEALIRGKGNP